MTYDLVTLRLRLTCLQGHYTITWFLWIASNQEHFNQALKEEFKEHRGKEAVNRLRYGYSGSAVRLLVSFLSPIDRDQISYQNRALPKFLAKRKSLHTP